MNLHRHSITRWKHLAITQCRTTVMPVLLRLAWPLIFARRWLRPQRVLLAKVESSDGNPPLAILCSAANQNKNYLSRLVFGGSQRETVLGQIALRDVFRQNLAAEQDCSLILVETNQSLFNWLQQDGWFFIPAWVNGETHLPIPEEFLKRNSVKSDLRLIRRSGFACTVTHDESLFQDFYHQMHRPFVRKFYGDEALLQSEDEMRQVCPQFDLLLVHKHCQPGQDLAGTFITYENRYPHLWAVGIREDGEDHVRDGILAAMYHFSFQYLFARGETRLNLGNSRALLRDGVLNFKKKLAQTLTGGSWQGFALKIASLTPSTQKFLLENPFIFSASGRLHGAVFVADALSLERIQQFYKEYFHPGLTQLVIFTFRDEETFSPATLPPPLAGHVAIRRASELVPARKV